MPEQDADARESRLLQPVSLGRSTRSPLPPCDVRTAPFLRSESSPLQKPSRFLMWCRISTAHSCFTTCFPSRHDNTDAVASAAEATMTQSQLSIRLFKQTSLARMTLLCGICACAEPMAAEDDSSTGAATSAASPAAGTTTGTAAMSTAPMSASAATRAQTAAQTAGAMASAASTSGSGAVAAAGAAASVAGHSASMSGAAPATGAAGSGATAGAAGGVGEGAAGVAAANGAGQGAAGEMSPAEDPTGFASELSELFIDAACEPSTPTPLQQGATCDHPPGTQRIEKMVTFGGETGTKYAVTLRVRGIWEPTNITGGEKPDPSGPFTVGGQVTQGAGSSSDAINYQQYSIEVAEPKQTYWLNNYRDIGHVIHKEDYEATITVSGGAALKVIMNDGNEREIANFTKDMFSDVPPYDKMPSLGQSLRLDVVKVEVSAP